MSAKGQQQSESTLVPFSLRDLLVYFLRLGTLGFGGPIALAGYMQRDLVEGRRWVSKQDYLEGLAFSQLSPGPFMACQENYFWIALIRKREKARWGLARLSAR
jgi:chromate transport protein ChrA